MTVPIEQTRPEGGEGEREGRRWRKKEREMKKKKESQGRWGSERVEEWKGAKERRRPGRN